MTMQAAVAANVARGTREQAEADARRDLQNLREKAIEAGRDRSRRIIKTSIIDRRNGDLRYNPAGRILRDWYLHVYLNTLRSNLGEPAIPIDAQQVEDAAADLHRVRPGVKPPQALRAAAVARDVAITDAAHAALDIVEPLASVARRRAIRHAPHDRFGGDELAVHITRHWYQRCYDDHIHGATRTRQPFTEISSAEEHEVARCLADGEARRLISPTGLPLMTLHGMAATELDRRLAAGESGLVSPLTDATHHTDPEMLLRKRIEKTWHDLDPHSRGHWLDTVAASPTAAERPWEQLGDDEQTAIIQLYLDTHRPAQVGVAYTAEPLDEQPPEAATTMFGHAMQLHDRSEPINDDAESRMPSQHDTAEPAVQSSRRSI